MNIYTLHKAATKDINEEMSLVASPKRKQFLEEILGNVDKVRVSWLGNREISIRGFTGSLEMCVLFKFYLQTPSAVADDEIQRSMDDLCIRLDKELNNTVVYWGIFETATIVFKEFKKMYPYA